MSGTVGLVGIGNMGRPIAGHLIAAGFDVVGYDRSADAQVTLLGSPAEVAARSDVVIVLVPSDEDAVEVCSGPSGVFAGARPSTVVLLSASIRPATCRELAGSTDVPVLDAALGGGARGAEAGEVTLFVGGDAAVLDRARPALEPWTKAVHLVGDVGAGQVTKTVNNLCHWGQIAVVVEALRLGNALGVPTAALRDAILDGPAASRTIAELPLMRLRWHAKDLANAAAMAEDVDLPMPVAEVVRGAMQQLDVGAVAELYGS
jgi:3-hydroxyisobutyrate dehydrogenase-like beta-hydroxyacid dehydrogenase